MADRAPVVWSPIAFVEREGCTIAYQEVGSGPIDVLFVHGFLSHREVTLDQPGYVAFFEALFTHARVLMFDKRGTGLSDRGKGAPTVEDTIGDMGAVLDAVGVKRATMIGTSHTTPLEPPMTSTLKFATLPLTMLSLACSASPTDSAPCGVVSIAVPQALRGQTTSAGTFQMTGALADQGETTKELTFGGPLDKSPVPVTFVRRMAGRDGVIARSRRVGYD